MSAWIGEKEGSAPYEVTPFEHVEKGGRLYLRWRRANNWRKQALRDERGRPVLARTAEGRLVKDRLRWAQGMAASKSRELAETAGVGRAAAAEPSAALTIVDAKRIVFHPLTGRYPTRSPARDEIERALDFAAHVWGAMEPPVTTWAQVRKAHIRALGRERIRQIRKRPGVDGYCGAEITVSKVLTVAAWLRDENCIPPGACVAPSEWRKLLREDWVDIAQATDDPKPKRPRHTLEEMRAIMAKASEIDQRFGLLMALGAEQRLGQVRRAWRGNLDLVKGLFRIPSRGRKQGALLELTAGQLAVVRHALEAGYLRHMERCAIDYPLFPGTQLSGSRGSETIAADPLMTQRHLTAPLVSRRQLRRWFLDCEAIAGVPHVKGRGAYGLRRAAVDAAVAEKISQDGLQAHGGWTNSKTPNEIYRETERVEARTEAKDVRAKIRGES